jgi:hypothetical protein
LTTFCAEHGLIHVL